MGLSSIHRCFIRLPPASSPVLPPRCLPQFYCDGGVSRGCGKHSSAVAISDVEFVNVKGTTSGKQGIRIDCSDTVPCTGIQFDNVNIKSTNGQDLSPHVNSAAIHVSDVLPVIKGAGGLRVGDMVRQMQGYCNGQGNSAVLPLGMGLGDSD